ncbi:MAG: peptidyl-prolyl cis-trans isomerase [Clostridia bacterium]|nr:peptidyl-prolyl cis-trans isomerase [Clostridia bacterium]
MKNRKKQARNKNILISVVSVIAILVLLYGIGYSTGFIQKNFTALKVGDYKISALEYRYYYTDAKTNLISEYGTEMAQNGVDFNKPLESQNYTETISWADYIHAKAVAELTEIYGMYGAAEKAGHVMSEEMKASVDSYMDAITGSAQSQSVDADKYLHQTYGKHIGEDEVREFITRRYYAADYVNKVQNEFEPTEEELETYYNENKNKLEVVDYNFYHVEWEVAEGNELLTNKNKEAAKKIAEDIRAKGKDAESFGKAVLENASEDMKPYYEDLSATLIEAGMIREDAGPIADWYSDDARKPGDSTIIEGDDKYTVILFHNKYLEEYNSVDVRHILIKPEEAEDPTDGEQVVAKHQEAIDKAEDIYDEYMAGEKTEDAFAALAEKYSEDNAEAGGLYTEVCKHEMDEAFEDWCFEAGRKPGDIGIVKTEYGYHIMYFVAENREAWHVQADKKLSQERFDEFFAEATEGQNVSKNMLAMNMAY